MKKEQFCFNLSWNYTIDFITVIQVLDPAVMLKPYLCIRFHRMYRVQI